MAKSLGMQITLTRNSLLYHSQLRLNYLKESNSHSMFALPNELLLEVLQHLGKQDLKNARLVSRLWSVHAADSLFTKIYVSPHKINLDVFEAICQHHLLRHCVKELEYDGVIFDTDLTWSQYTIRTWDEMCHALGDDMSQVKLDGPDRHVNNFVQYVRDDGFQTLCDFQRPEEFYADIRAKCESFTFMKEGYQAYSENAIHQDACYTAADFSNRLSHGLNLLSRLDSVTISDEWPPRGTIKATGSVSTCLNGSPLARYWNPFWTRPRRWSNTLLCPPQFSDGSDAYWLLTAALSKAQRHIRSFGVTNRAATSITFDAEVFPQKEHLEHAASAYRNLESMSLSFGCYFDTQFEEDYSDVLPHEYWRLLRGVLGSVTTLKILRLHIPWRHLDSQDEQVATYGRIFFNTTVWPHLTTFSVSNFAITIEDLMHLLLVQMPRLKQLSLDCVNLLQGRWEGVIEVLRILNRLSSLKLHDGGELRHSGYTIYSIDIPSDAIQDRVDRIESYVTKWPENSHLRHPSLTIGEPMEKSLDYLIDLFRHCDVFTSGDISEKLAIRMKEYKEGLGMHERSRAMYHQESL